MEDPEKISTYFEANKELWNNKSHVHFDSEFYDNESFLNGRNSLNEIELEYLQEIEGKRILHIQCHFGQDSISLARMGGIVTGTDISNVALTKAWEMNAQLGTNVTFIETPTYDIDKYVEGTFDLIFMSYGVIPWLPDLNLLSSIVTNKLSKGGKVLLTEFHPFFNSFDHPTGKIAYSYNNQHVYEETEEGSYADRDSSISGKEYFWQHSIEEILMAFINQGLTLDIFREYYYSPYEAYAGMHEKMPGKYVYGDFKYPIPHIFLSRFRK